MNKAKLKDEYQFLATVPAEIRHYYPVVKDFQEESSSSHYLIQKIPVSDLSFEIIKKDVNESVILKLLNKLDEYLSVVPVRNVTHAEWMEAIKREIQNKNLERLQQIETLSISDELNFIAQAFGFANIRQYIETLNQMIWSRLENESQTQLTFSHGDMCFSNMLLQNDQLYLIDPKGAQHQIHNFRPVHYELAKICQSLIGQYDFINHGLYEIKNRTELKFSYSSSLNAATECFKRMIVSKNSSIKNVRLVEASLFASLIPFHQESDEKMKAFLINSLTIFKDAQ